jgi:hypothetical protein
MMKKMIVVNFMVGCLGALLVSLLMNGGIIPHSHPVWGDIPVKPQALQVVQRTSIAVVNHLEVLTRYNQVLNKDSTLSGVEKQARLVYLSGLIGRIEESIAQKDHVTFLISAAVDTGAVDLTSVVYEEALKYQDEALKKGLLSTPGSESVNGGVSATDQDTEKEENIVIGDDTQKKLDRLLSGMNDSLKSE